MRKTRIKFGCAKKCVSGLNSSDENVAKRLMNTFQEDEAHLRGGREAASREGHLARGVVRALRHYMVVLQGE